MNWLYRGLMAASIVGAALVTAGVLPVAFAGVATAVGVAAGLFHDKPGGGPQGAVAVALLFAVGASSCAHVKTIAKDCSEQAIEGQASNVEAALASDNYVAALEALVVQFGECAITEAVKAVANPPVAAETRATAIQSEKAARARAWLASRGK